MKQGRRAAARMVCRVIVLAIAVAVILGGPWPGWVARVVPGASPLAAPVAGLAQRAWFAGLWWGLPIVVLLAMAVWRGRWFCRWVCPTGTLVTLVSKLSLKRRILAHPIAGYVFWGIVAGAALGLPLYLFLDPLAGFNRFIPLIRGTLTGAAWTLGAIVPVALLLCLLQPAVWCSHVCPMGYLFETVDHRRGRLPARANRERRRFLGGMVLGLAPAWLLGRLYRREAAPLLPPGALPSERFAGVCTRCYACVKACPTGVLGVRWPESGRRLVAWFEPEMDPDDGPCEEYCRACTQVCPTGAIRSLTEDQKRHRQLGVAEVRRDACLAWADGQYCMVCDEFCPYNAIETDLSAHDLPRPVVIADRCRGCGYCQNACPAIRAGKAIVVKGIPEQRWLGG